jgi:hypothetical protein
MFPSASTTTGKSVLTSLLAINKLLNLLELHVDVGWWKTYLESWAPSSASSTALSKQMRNTRIRSSKLPAVFTTFFSQSPPGSIQEV